MPRRRRVVSAHALLASLTRVASSGHCIAAAPAAAAVAAGLCFRETGEKKKKEEN